MIKFGPSGNSESFLLEKHKGTEDAAKWCADRGLDCYEYSFGRGVNLGEEKAREAVSFMEEELKKMLGRKTN